MAAVYMWPRATFVLQWQSQVVATENFKIFIVWPFEETFANTLSEVRKCGLSLEARKRVLW